MLALLGPVSAGLNAKRLESEMKNATVKGTLIAFYFEQGYYNPNCPKCIVDVNANNKAMKQAFPRRYASVITIDAGETRGLENLPACVKAAKKGTPQIIVTTAACDKVVATIEGRPDRKKADAFEKIVGAATTAPVK